MCVPSNSSNNNIEEILLLGEIKGRTFMSVHTTTSYVVR